MTDHAFETIMTQPNPCTAPSPSALVAALQREARAAGFDAIGIAPADAFGRTQAGARLDAFLARGRHGDMSWMAETAARRRDPRTLWPEVRSIVMLAMNYGPERDPLGDIVPDPLGRGAGPVGHGAISCYARGKDYHAIIKRRLKRVAGWLHRETGRAVKVFVDTAPVMEKPLAALAGLGWQGKHTNLVSRTHGSWLFLGAIFSAHPLPASAPFGRERCGTCRACLDICPTRAFPAPWQLDARRCISYLTIEHKGHIARALRPAMGNRIFGCDDCLAVCPWNKFARRARDVRLHAREATDRPRLEALLGLDEAGFRARFQGTPVKRAGRDRFLRNVLIAAGNSGERALLPAIRAHLGDASPLVRAMAVWALGRIGTRDEIEAGAAWWLAQEQDAAVREEWRLAREDAARKEADGP